MERRIRRRKVIPPSPGIVKSVGVFYMKITILTSPEEVEQALALKVTLEDQGHEVELHFNRPSGDGFYLM